MYRSILCTLVAALIHASAARDVFAHYMVQGLDGGTTHAADDVKAALAMGITGFALNVGDASALWALDSISQLFTAASGTDLKFFFSMDLAQDKNAYNFTNLINRYISNANYYTYKNLPFLSTFSAAGTGPEYWPDFLAKLERDVYFVPDFDDGLDYYTNFDDWLGAWGGVVHGIFSWETTWPSTSDTTSNVSTSQDDAIMTSAHKAGKSYMIGLSSLQYKHWSGNHWYRAGEVNLPERMTQILALHTLPEFVEILTWNDAGESHYISELHNEGLTPEILAYANNAGFPHTGWQPLITSFITAFKNGVDASGMRPPSGKAMIGSMWYRTILTSASCSSDSLGKPSGSGAAKDAVNWAIVVNDGVAGVKAQVWSDGELIWKSSLSAGLNYFSTPGMRAGIQYIEVVDGENKILYSAQGAVDVQAEAGSVFCSNVTFCQRYLLSTQFSLQLGGSGPVLLGSTSRLWSLASAKPASVVTLRCRQLGHSYNREPTSRGMQTEEPESQGCVLHPRLRTVPHCSSVEPGSTAIFARPFEVRAVANPGLLEKLDSGMLPPHALDGGSR
ncbi:hypothetical protein JX265_011552 [Neoarthrinium moseri]|uniref:Glycoside hydrolase family 71 protein n=1 Tax=Neoarthrinium moseri TaxID=1658444 RepID=A0A9P9WC61_9PEZI|nr:uncharacterized protein JN550_011698 [Neoarthrinium moseri]KAI1848594.1 hypothetical protein JX266_005453 [Neoarthrinium moseri]KAI1856593.1 hypothetical protein JX265_011552 [Neoarthrinium moseri]KAI1860014.1 hypothetical protein JN550_011698 [Neoarthrinium moseri]